MIVYFSAEGNSKHVATELAHILGDNATHISQCSPEINSRTLIIVCPVYCWGIPVAVREWTARIRAEKIDYCAVILTCGDDIGYADKMMARDLSMRNVTLDCCMSVQMPNTYVILPGFNVDSKEVEKEKLKAAENRINEIADILGQRIRCNDVTPGTFPRIKTKLLYPLFVKWGITTSKFNATDSCISCGKCAIACPRHNIIMTQGESPRPKWGEDCISCLACYHVCPNHSVQYGRITLNKGQYLFPAHTPTNKQ